MGPHVPKVVRYGYASVSYGSHVSNVVRYGYEYCIHVGPHVLYVLGLRWIEVLNGVPHVLNVVDTYDLLNICNHVH